MNDEMMEPKVSDVVAAVDHFAPFRLAESWDNCGLQFGDPKGPAGRILVGLEVTRDLIEEAVALEATTILTHHPLLFHPPKSFAETSTVPQLAAQLIRAGLSHIAAHTNFDSVAYGTNGILADMVDLQVAGRKFLIPAENQPVDYKYSVFVPVDYIDKAIAAMASVGAGMIGDYSHCTFRSPGVGTYTPLEGSNPFSGEVGDMKQAEEVKLECVCPMGSLDALVNAVREVHPYEEVAYDVYPMIPQKKPTAGLGLIGSLKKKVSIQTVAQRLKKAMKLKSLTMVGELRKTVETVAICSGAGGSIIRNWRPGTADLFLTGEMTHHDCAEAKHMGVPVLMVGHWESEVVACSRMAELLEAAMLDAGFEDMDILVSRTDVNPIKYL